MAVLRGSGGIAVAGDNGVVVVLEEERLKPTSHLLLTGPVSSLEWSPVQRLLAVSGASRDVVLWSPWDRQPATRGAGDSHRVRGPTARRGLAQQGPDCLCVGPAILPTSSDHIYSGHHWNISRIGCTRTRRCTGE